MRFGLREADLSYIVNTIIKFPEIQKAVIFGSRAKGNYKEGSDVDIAVFGKDITFSTLSHLHSLLEDESPMPYFFDIVDYKAITTLEFKKHIDRVGKVIFSRD